MNVMNPENRTFQSFRVPIANSAFNFHSHNLVRTYPNTYTQRLTIHQFIENYWRLKRRAAVAGGFHVWSVSAGAVSGVLKNLEGR
jgi:hypothetical protein